MADVRPGGGDEVGHFHAVQVVVVGPSTTDRHAHGLTASRGLFSGVAASTTAAVAVAGSATAAWVEDILPRGWCC